MTAHTPTTQQHHPDAATDALFPASDHFPLGRAFGAVEPRSEAPSQARPFGLHYAVEPPPIPVDLTGFAYDPARQIGVIRDGDTAAPLMRHTTGTTSTRTSDGHKDMDSDSDQRED